MKIQRILDQDIAVFGESGSGKTVLLSSFYGSSQEREFAKFSDHTVLAQDPGQGARLHGNYLGMKKRGEVPDFNKFRGDTYQFIVKPRPRSAGDARRSTQPKFDQLRLNWHDYPGEWFHEDVNTETEKQRRLETFKTLLGSDVALLLVDGQKLVECKGEEQKYLKRLFTSYKNLVALLHDDLTAKGKLTDFPRIWIVALSKADLLPDLDARDLRDLINDGAVSELNALRDVLRNIVSSPEALSVGEDFLVLSSAKFEDDQIDVGQTKGLNLMLPLAGVFPVERFVQWTKEQKIKWKTAESVLGWTEGALVWAAPLLQKLPSQWRAPATPTLSFLVTLVQAGQEELLATNREAFDNGADWEAILSRFQIDLHEAKQRDVLLAP